MSPAPVIADVDDARIRCPRRPRRHDDRRCTVSQRIADDLADDQGGSTEHAFAEQFAVGLGNSVRRADRDECTCSRSRGSVAGTTIGGTVPSDPPWRSRLTGSSPFECTHRASSSSSGRRASRRTCRSSAGGRCCSTSLTACSVSAPNRRFWFRARRTGWRRSTMRHLNRRASGHARSRAGSASTHSGGAVSEHRRPRTRLPRSPPPAVPRCVATQPATNRRAQRRRPRALAISGRQPVGKVVVPGRGTRPRVRSRGGDRCEPRRSSDRAWWEPLTRDWSASDWHTRVRAVTPNTRCIQRAPRPADYPKHRRSTHTIDSGMILRAHHPRPSRRGDDTASERRSTGWQASAGTSRSRRTASPIAVPSPRIRTTTTRSGWRRRSARSRSRPRPSTAT